MLNETYNVSTTQERIECFKKKVLNTFFARDDFNKLCYQSKKIELTLNYERNLTPFKTFNKYEKSFLSLWKGFFNLEPVISKQVK